MEALIGKNYWGFYRGELGSLITAGQSNGGGVGGVVLWFSLGWGCGKLELVGLGQI